MGIEDWGSYIQTPDGGGYYTNPDDKDSDDAVSDGPVQLPPPNTVKLQWQRRQLQELPTDFGQLTALQTLNLSRTSACAEWRCCCGFWTVELGER